MKYSKINKLAKCLIASTILAAGVVAATVPIISNKNTTANSSSTTEKIQTGKIIHNANAQVVNNTNEIVITDVSTHTASSIAIVENNGVQEMYVWGDNRYGQLGIGSTEQYISNPVKFDMSVFGEYTSIDFNYDDNTGTISYAIVNTAAGQKLFTWGDNRAGQLGINSTTNATSPQLVNSTDLGDYDSIESIICGAHYNSLTYANIMVITKKNSKQEIYITGNNNTGQLANKTTNGSLKFILIPSTLLGNYDAIDRISMNNASAHAVVKIGSTLALYVWGNNQSGQLGLNSSTNILTPTLHTNSIFSSSNLANMELSFDQASYAWIKNGAIPLYVWGANSSAQLGLNSTTNVTVPTQLSMSKLGGAAASIKKIAIGDGFSSHAIVEVANQPKIYVWGNNVNTELGIGNTTNQLNPVEFQTSSIGNPSDVTKIKQFELPKWSDYSLSSSLSPYALVEINNKDVLYVWGDNTRGQCGNGTTTAIAWPTPMNIPATGSIIDVSRSSGATIITLNNNGIIETYACGYNAYGQLGTGNTTNISTLTPILPLKQSKLATLKAEHSMSATDAYNALRDMNGNMIKSELNKYADFSSFPSNTNFKINSVDSNFTTGVLNLEITPNLIHAPLAKYPVNSNTLIPLKITGFKPVNVIDAKPVIALDKKHENLNADQFFVTVTGTNGKINRTELEKYLDLSAIPSTATIELKRIPNADEYKADFTFYSNAVYTNGGQTINQNYHTSVNVVLYRFPIEAVVLSSVGGILLLLILITVFVIIRARRKAIGSFTNYL